MLYVFHGADTSLAHNKARTLIQSLQAKKPDSSYVKVDADHWADTIIDEHVGGQGLFSKAYIVFLDRVTEKDGAEDILSDAAAIMHESANVFIVLEGKLSLDLKKKLEKHADKMIEVGAASSLKVGKPESFNIFALADAIGQKNSMKAWELYRQSIDAGIEPENVSGTIFWQLKSMCVAAGASSASESGLSPFVFTKAKKAAGNYSANALGAFMQKIITLYHDAHRGKVDMELGMERVLLEL